MREKCIWLGLMRNWVVEFPMQREKWFATASCMLSRAVQRKAQASCARSGWKGRFVGYEGAEARDVTDMAGSLEGGDRWESGGMMGDVGGWSQALFWMRGAKHRAHWCARGGVGGRSSPAKDSASAGTIAHGLPCASMICCALSTREPEGLRA